MRTYVEIISIHSLPQPFIHPILTILGVPPQLQIHVLGAGRAMVKSPGQVGQAIGKLADKYFRTNPAQKQARKRTNEASTTHALPNPNHYDLAVVLRHTRPKQILVVRDVALHVTSRDDIEPTAVFPSNDLTLLSNL